jgi:hypothetical protein
MSIQGFLIPWMLVGILNTTPDLVGYSRALIMLPPMAVLFIGALFADGMDSRKLLLALSVAVCIPPLIIGQIPLSFWPVVAFGMVMAIFQSLSDPARQAMLSRITRTDIQRTVTLTTVITSLVGVGGVWIGGQLELLGIERVLLLQAALFVLGIVALSRLPSLPAYTSSSPNLAAGFKAVWRRPLVRNIIALNFFSSLFNAGAYAVSVPFIVRDVYHGDAAFFASVMIAFTIGSIGSNVILYFFMPLLHPGRVYVLMQLVRPVILGILFFEPSLWLFFTSIFVWGLNMGVTATLSRTTVQELAPASHRAQVLAILLFSFMVSSPISAIILGQLIQATDPLTGLLPGIPVSLLIFAIGAFASGLWSYRSVSHPTLGNR